MRGAERILRGYISAGIVSTMWEGVAAAWAIAAGMPRLYYICPLPSVYTYKWTPLVCV